MSNSESGESASVIQENSVDNQFRRVEKFEVAGGTAEVVDIHPPSPKSTVPVLLAPGWGCTIKTYETAIKTLAGCDRRVVAFNHPRIGNNMSATEAEIGKNYPTEQLRRALNIIGVLEQKGIEKTDVIAHSDGAVNTVIAATLYPEKFRNIVLFGPAGLMGKDNFIRLLIGFARQKEVTATALEEAKKYFAENPVRAITEGRDLANSQIHNMLYDLHNKGIGIVVISGIDDPAFPMKRMQKIVKTGMPDGFLSVRGAHGEIGAHPGLYMRAAEEMLTKLEAKKAKKPVRSR